MKKLLVLSALTLFVATATFAGGKKHKKECAKKEASACCKKDANAKSSCCKKGGEATAPAAAPTEKK